MDKKLERIEEKLDKVDEKLDQVVKTQVEQAADLKHHIYRTTLAEEHLKLLESQIKPVQKHVEQVNTILRVIGVAASGVTITAALVKILEFIL